MLNYFNNEFSSICILTLITIFILISGGFIRIYAEYSKNKDAKVKYLPVIAKPSIHYGWYIAFLILSIPNVLLEIENIKLSIKLWGSVYVINNIYRNIAYLIIFIMYFFIVIFFWQVTCGNIILINDKFVFLYSGRINWGEVNYVDIFPIKGIFKRRKVDIYVNGKLHTRFSIRNKYTCNIINIFKDRCTMV